MAFCLASSARAYDSLTFSTAGKFQGETHGKSHIRSHEVTRCFTHPSGPFSGLVSQPFAVHPPLEPFLRLHAAPLTPPWPYARGALSLVAFCCGFAPAWHYGFGEFNLDFTLNNTRCGTDKGTYGTPNEASISAPFASARSLTLRSKEDRTLQLHF